MIITVDAICAVADVAIFCLYFVSEDIFLLAVVALVSSITIRCSGKKPVLLLRNPGEEHRPDSRERWKSSLFSLGVATL